MDLTQVGNEDFEAEVRRRNKIKDDYYESEYQKRYAEQQRRRGIAFKAMMEANGLGHLAEEQQDDIYAACRNFGWEWDE